MGQEQLIVVAEQTGQMHVREVNFGAEVAVSIAERAIRLQNVITLMARVNMLNGFLSFEDPAVQTYGERAEQVREAARGHIRDLMAQANEEFDYASGSIAMLEAGVPKNQVKKLRIEAFSDFHKKNSGSRNSVRAQAYRRQLAKTVDLVQSGAPLEPGPQVKKRAEAKPLGAASDERLTKPERLRIVKEDQRAGFLPATTREKNTVLTFLDYLDNEAYPWGVNSQLHEVFIHQQRPKDASMAEGRRAVESIVYELTDYLTNAVNSHGNLAQLQQLLAECPNPKVTVAEEIGAEHPAYGALLRYRDLRELHDSGEVEGLRRDPLRTREDRWTHEGPGKHKIIEDQYTTTEPKPLFAKRLADFPGKLTVHQGRLLLTEALENEERRAAFFTARLEEIKAIPGQRIFTELLSAVDDTLSSVQLRVS